MKYRRLVMLNLLRQPLINFSNFNHKVLRAFRVQNLTTSASKLKQRWAHFKCFNILASKVAKFA